MLNSSHMHEFSPFTLMGKGTDVCLAIFLQANSESFVVKTLDRKTLWEMQTPQVNNKIYLIFV